MNLSALPELKKEAVPEAAKQLTREEIAALAALLGEKNDRVRYPAFLLLCARSEVADDVFPYWDTFAAMLGDELSYRRGAALRLLALNARWDDSGRTEAVLDAVIERLCDEIPFVVRWCVQSLGVIVRFHPACGEKVAQRLAAFDLSGLRESMRKPAQTDIADTLLAVRTVCPCEAAFRGLVDALSGGLPDGEDQKANSGGVDSRRLRRLTFQSLLLF